MHNCCCSPSSQKQHIVAVSVVEHRTRTFHSTQKLCSSRAAQAPEMLDLALLEVPRLFTYERASNDGDESVFTNFPHRIHKDESPSVICSSNLLRGRGKYRTGTRLLSGTCSEGVCRKRKQCQDIHFVTTFGAGKLR